MAGSFYIEEVIDMIIFLCSPSDISAPCFLATLRHQYGIKAKIITPQELVYAPAMEHFLDGHHVTSSVTTNTHGTLDNTSMTAVVNRLSWLPDAHLATVNTTDRGYIQQELQAIWSSWISALPCLVINRPTATSMSGSTFHHAIWQHYAALTGLPTASMIYDSAQPEPTPILPVHSIIVCQDRCHSTSPLSQLYESCRNLADYTGFDMLEIFFGEESDGKVVFSYASPIPYLNHTVSSLTSQMAQMLQGGTL